MHGIVPARQITAFDAPASRIRFGMLRCLVFLLLAGTLLGCSDARRATESIKATFNPPPAPPDTIPEALDYAADLRVDISEMAKLPVGVLYADSVAGTGQEVALGDSVEVAVQGWLPNGTLIDSTVVTMRVGSGDVIAGIDAALPGMKPGGRRKLVIPPGLAYGAEGRDNVPANSVVVYDVELRARIP